MWRRPDDQLIRLTESSGMSWSNMASTATENRVRHGKGAEEEITLEEVEGQLTPGASIDEPLVKQDLLSMPLREAREHFERAYLRQQLILCDGKVGRLAERIGMERTHLYRKLNALGVDFRQVSADE